MQLKVGNVVKTADGGVGVLKFLGENFAKVEHSDGHEIWKCGKTYRPLTFQSPVNGCATPRQPRTFLAVPLSGQLKRKISLGSRWIRASKCGQRKTLALKLIRE